MKKIIVFMLLFSSLAIAHAQDYFMYVGGENAILKFQQSGL